MSKFLTIPIQLEALYLPKATPVREGFADFTSLPYSDEQQDYNPDVAYLSEELLTPPFQDENLILPAGMHLHWYLPGTLTANKRFGDRGKLPAVPDRWLVTRYREKVLEKSWLVESDFLTEEAVDNGMVRCHVPYYDGNPSSRNKPYRFLGRVVELADSWQRNQTATGNRVQYLTAIGYEPQLAEQQPPVMITGYGEPTFAAFYPHCNSVFGFYDRDVTPTPGLSYQVLGFYARPGNDYLTQFIANFTQAQAGQSYSPRQFNALLQQAIKEQFLWDFAFDGTSLADAPAKAPTLADVALPNQSLFRARIDFGPTIPSAVNPLVTAYSVAVGNTGTEALAAFLGTKLADKPGAKLLDKVVIENQLEAIQLTSKLNNRTLDLGAKFREARHEKGFSSLPGETHWTVVVRSTTSPAATTDDDHDSPAEDAVPAHDLQVLNALQLQHERALLDLETVQQHLFADWSKYMLCAYPPPDSLDAYPAVDEAKNYIEQQLTAAEQGLAATGTLQLTQDEQGHLTAAALATGSTTSLAAQLGTQLNNVLALVAAANLTPEAQRSNKHYSLKTLAGPRYWRPNDPVLLLARPGSTVDGLPTGGRNPRATLACVVTDLAQPFDADNLTGAALRRLQSYLYPSSQLPTITWTNNPWQPFLLEWQVKLAPASVAGNITNPDRQYSADFIATHYQLDEGNPDFSPREAPDTTIEGETVYSGMTILTPNASIKLAADLNDYLLDWLKADLPTQYFLQAAVPGADQTYAYLEQHLDDFGKWVATQKLGLTPLPAASDPALPTALDTWWQANLAALVAWYLALPAATQPPALIQNLLRCYQQLQGWQCLAQSLGGFNEALLMRKQTRQLEVAEPLGFGEYQDFTGRVRRAVAGRTTTAPQPLNDFMPLRSGHLEVLALRLIDNFGQTVEVEGVKQLIASEPLRDVVHPDKVALRPRLSQASRLNFRWLAGRRPATETTSHPDASPICGWLVPNYLDNSLSFHDEYGQALGLLTLDSDAPWQNAPGSTSPTTIGRIENEHLRQVAQYLYDRQLASLQRSGPAQPPFLEVFISTLESALEQIDPENFAQHPDMALLMGRPVAVARVSLDLQLRGQPAAHQGWNVFIKALQGDSIETDSFDLVEFPVRLGEYQQLNDGLVGYWAETSEAQLAGPFYSPYSPDSAGDAASPTVLQARHPDIITYQVQDGTPLNVLVKVNEPAHTYTLLLDPRGQVHATAGIVPAKAIAIPATQYTQALRRIEIAFQVAPLLSELGKTNISLPVEPGYAWSWLEQTAPAQWRELFREPTITQQVLLEKLPTIDGLWEALTSAGWLVPLADWPGTASIRPKDQRNPATVPAVAQAGVSDPAQVLANIDRVLDAYGQYIQPPVTAATFGPQIIREGWLKLRPVLEAAT